MTKKTAQKKARLRTYEYLVGCMIDGEILPCVCVAAPNKDDADRMAIAAVKRVMKRRGIDTYAVTRWGTRRSAKATRVFTATA